MLFKKLFRNVCNIHADLTPDAPISSISMYANRCFIFVERYPHVFSYLVEYASFRVTFPILTQLSSIIFCNRFLFGIKLNMLLYLLDLVLSSIHIHVFTSNYHYSTHQQKKYGAELFVSQLNYPCLLIKSMPLKIWKTIVGRSITSRTSTNFQTEID